MTYVLPKEETNRKVGGKRKEKNDWRMLWFSTPVASIKWLWGLSEWPTLTPPPRFGPSVKGYFLVRVRSLHLSTIPFVLVSNFPFVLTLTKYRQLVWDILRGKFAKQLLSVFFLPNEVISYVYKGQSICSVLVNMQHHEVVQSRVSRCWAQIRLHPL